MMKTEWAYLTLGIDRWKGADRVSFRTQRVDREGITIEATASLYLGVDDELVTTIPVGDRVVEVRLKVTA